MGQITNSAEYDIAKSWVQRFEQTLTEFLESEATKSLHPKQRELEKMAIRGQLETLQAEVAEYESVCR